MGSQVRLEPDIRVEVFYHPHTWLKGTIIRFDDRDPRRVWVRVDLLNRTEGVDTNRVQALSLLEQLAWAAR